MSCNYYLNNGIDNFYFKMFIGFKFVLSLRQTFKIFKMKKIILLSAIGAVSVFGASAQFINHSSALVKEGRGVISSAPEVVVPTGSSSTSKTTASGYRQYDHASYMESTSTTAFQGRSLIIWQDSTIRQNFTSGLGTINFTSVCQTLFPFDNLWNDSANPNFVGKIRVTATNSYVIDSVGIAGFYIAGTTTAKAPAAQVDTLLVTVATQPANNNWYWRGSVSSWALPYLPSGKDTLWASAPINVDSIRKTAASNPSTATKTTFPILLNSSNRIALSAASTFQDFNAKVPGTFTVPAGNVVMVSYTFRTGGTWIKNSDTVTERHHFRPGFVYPGTTTVSDRQKYNWYSGDRTMSSIMFSTDTNFYTPTVVIGALNTPTAWFNQYLLNTINITCASCDLVPSLSINENSLFSDVKAFPNPANTELNVPFTTTSKAAVTVSITNMLGQVIATQNMNANAGQTSTATFNTSNLASGVYLYTLESDGQRVSNRFSVAH
jgi:hypothetical protein